MSHSHVSRMRWIGCAPLAVLVLSACVSSASTRAGDIEGAWQLVAYEVGGVRYEVAGHMVINAGAWGLVYSMQKPGGEKSHRAHAGAYTFNGSRIEFDVQQWVEHVDGVARVVPGVKRSASVEADEQSLSLTLGNGAVQRFSRVSSGKLSARASDKDHRLASIQVSGQSMPASGLMVAAGGRWVLVGSTGSDESASGFGSGGEFVRSGVARTLWSHGVGNLGSYRPDPDAELRLEDLANGGIVVIDDSRRIRWTLTPAK